jgi:hypothetical protein
MNPEGDDAATVAVSISVECAFTPETLAWDERTIDFLKLYPPSQFLSLALL